MSLDVALQSVAFYVLSCATCSKISHRRKAKANAKRERAEKAELETEQPGLYRHPSPFSTNPFWNEEIQLGPTLPSKKNKGGSKNASSRALNRQESSDNGESYMSTDAGSSPSMVTEDHRLSGDNWNRKRYQREDEHLWGREQPPTAGQKIWDVFARAETSVGSTLRHIEERLSKSNPPKEEQKSPYFVARNPPVNDLHPPVVSTAPTSRDATRWMLQPPPSARVMEGKERANRSRSGSGGSSNKGCDNENLSRQVTGRAVEERIRRGETPSDLELRSLSRPISRQVSTKAKRNGRSRSVSTESGNSDGIWSEGATTRRRGIPSPFSIAADRRLSIDSIQSGDTMILGGTPDMREAARPALRTIVSSSLTVPQATANSKPTNGPIRIKSKRSSSSRQQKELIPPTTDQALNSRSPSPSLAAVPTEPNDAVTPMLGDSTNKGTQQILGNKGLKGTAMTEVENGAVIMKENEV